MAKNIAHVTDYWSIMPKQKTHLCYERFANVCRVYPQTNVGKLLIPCRHAAGQANTPCPFWQNRLTETLIPTQFFIWKKYFLHFNLNRTGFLFNLILHNNLALASIAGDQRQKVILASLSNTIIAHETCLAALFHFARINYINRHLQHECTCWRAYKPMNTWNLEQTVLYCCVPKFLPQIHTG